MTKREERTKRIEKLQWLIIGILFAVVVNGVYDSIFYLVTGKIRQQFASALAVVTVLGLCGFILWWISLSKKKE
ncbi:MAG: hypothetical protein GWO20_18000 [Candidatus Korarchaeota archaeon]|nr:hypothetical protein [Candidatus Korarchaeota archaeon]